MATREDIEYRVIRMHTAAVVCASKGLRLTYGDLAGYIGRPHEQGALDAELNLWAKWLHSKKGLPDLYSIVINKETGKPGRRIGVEDDKQIARAQAASYQHEWAEVPPPTFEELKALRG